MTYKKSIRLLKLPSPVIIIQLYWQYQSYNNLDIPKNKDNIQHNKSLYT